jgi:hypothetical protein
MSFCRVRRSVAGPIAALQDDTYWAVNRPTKGGRFSSRPPLGAP